MAEIAAVNKIPSWSNYWNAPEQSAATAQTVQAPVDWIDRWKAAREKVPGPKAKIDFGYPGREGIYKYVSAKDYYLEYLNCPSGAFQHAVTILNRRISLFGAESPYVKQWLVAQDEVFANCAAGFGYPPRPSVVSIPAPAPATDPKLIRQDRAYQIAAAHFYAGDLAQAQKEFAAIGKDSTSPYGKIAPYLVARCLVREGTLTLADDKINAPPLEQAERRLESILPDPRLDPYHHSARGLLQFVCIRLYPRRRGRELALALDGASPDPQFHQNLVDYLWLFDRSISRETPKPPSMAGAMPHSPVAAPPGGMTDWILTFSKPGSASFAHALAQWRQTRSRPWLVAAISQAQGSDPASTQLVADAADVPRDSPAYVTVTFHRLRLLAETGHAAEARRGLDEMLENTRTGLTQGPRNGFLALRMSLSRSLVEWLRFAARRPVDMGGYEYATPAQMAKAGVQEDFFDRDAAVTLTEKLPLTILATASRSALLPAGLRRGIATATWTRAILLGDSAVARREAPVLASLVPELGGSLAAYQAAKGGAQRKFAAIFLLLRFPGMRPFVPVGVPRWSVFKGPQSPTHIDMFRNNWWCAMGPQAGGSSWQFNYQTTNQSLTSPLRLVFPDGKIPSPAFLTANERAASRKEWSALERLPTAPNWLAREALAWAKAHPHDPRMPEALYLVVRATRYGCNDANTGRDSKQAFQLLHQRYP